jgi:hypothetical protein
MPTGPAPSSQRAPSALRASVERSTRPLLLRLHALPRPVVPLATVALVVIGVLAPPAVGLLALGVVALFVVWIAYLSWPVVPLGGRVLRVVMVGLVVLLGLTRW